MNRPANIRDLRPIWSRATLKRRRRALRERTTATSVRKSAAAARKLRDPRTGCFVRVLDQPIRRARDPRTGLFYSTNDPPVDLVFSGTVPMPKKPGAKLTAALAERDQQRAAVAEVVARYPLRPLFRRDAKVTDGQLVQFESDARRILERLAARSLKLEARAPKPKRAHGIDLQYTDTLIAFSRRVSRLEEAMARIAGHYR
jgi:hypothetical protein